MTADERFEQLGLSLPPAPDPIGVYKPCLIIGNHLYVSGHGPMQNDKKLMAGRVGKELTMEEGKIAARQVGLTILSTIKKNIGSLDKIKKVMPVCSATDDNRNNL